MTNDTFTPDEAQFIVDLIGSTTISVPISAMAKIADTSSSILAKCDTIIRTAQPLASAAKPTPHPSTNGDAPQTDNVILDMPAPGCH